jgi:hypothetical protein
MLTPLPPLILTMGLVWPARSRLAGTTLVAPWAWAMVAVAFWAAIEVWFAVSPEVPPAPWRYLASVGTFCPLIAVLGAKRPQDRGWQWIVASLWLVLAIPMGQHVLFTSGQTFSVFAAWTLFLAVLLALELLNYLPTRHAGSVLLVVASQGLLLSDSLGWNASSNSAATAAAWLAFAAVGLAWLTKRPPAAEKANDSRLLAASQLWVSFRNTFGAFWALRVLQRVNQTAEIQNWPVRLEWSGFHSLPDRNDVTPVEDIDQCLHSLLRRFMSNSELTPPV